MGSAKLITSRTTIVLEGTSKVDIASSQVISPLENKGSDSDSDWVAINVEQSVKIWRRSKYISSIWLDVRFFRWELIYFLYLPLGP